MEFPKTSEDFEELVRHTMERTGKSFVLGVYEAMDMLYEMEAERELKLACCSGCSFCCHQLVSCTELEWHEIRRFVRANWRGMRKRVGEARRRWMKYFSSVKHELSDPTKAMKPAGDWFGKPCAFLSKDGCCTIYPVRPPDCRTMTSTARCTSWNQPEATRFRSGWELWANNLLLEEQQRKSGRGEVAYLPHWLCTMD